MTCGISIGTIAYTLIGGVFMAKVAYVRVSSVDQNVDRQLVELEKCGINKWFTEKVSGKDRNRTELKRMLDYVRDGDTVYIESISRLARNTLDFLTIVKELGERGIEIISLKENIDTSSPQGKFMLTIFGAMYELERESIKQRQAEGIAVAKEKGKVTFGRPKVEYGDFPLIYRKWRNGEVTAASAMRTLQMKANTFYRRVKEIEKS
jgi:DNA invertase Pin-like site-specific DNA recombinase